MTNIKHISFIRNKNKNLYVDPAGCLHVHKPVGFNNGKVAGRFKI
jgi:hypothetical protein